MKYLITGGAGFIGSHLVEKLLKAGHQIIVIDDLSTGSEANLAPHANNSNLEVHYDSVENADLLEKATKECDIVYHLAAAVGVKKIIEDPIDSMHRNIVVAETMLTQAAKFKKPILVASTSEVYGKSDKFMFSEGDDIIYGATTILRWSYAASKAIDEFLALAYHKFKDLPVVITRFFNTVGPRQSHKYGMVIPNFVASALANEPLVVHGDGSQTRCFLHVFDAIHAIHELMNLKDGAYGKIFNIGSDEEISINHLAERIIRATNSKSTIKYIPYSDVYNNQGTFEDVKRRMPDVRRVKEHINFSCKYRLDDIISDTIEFYQQEKKSGKLDSAA